MLTRNAMDRLVPRCGGLARWQAGPMRHILSVKLRSLSIAEAGCLTLSASAELLT
jgi:hypothetical protein